MSAPRLPDKLPLNQNRLAALKLVELDLGFKGYPFGTAIIHPA